MVLALNTVSGKIADVSPKMLEHPAFKNVLVPVDEGTKPYNSELYRPGTVEEKVEERPSKSFFGLKKNDTNDLTDETETNIDIEEEN